jgi:hypothetical protein
VEEALVAHRAVSAVDAAPAAALKVTLGEAREATERSTRIDYTVSFRLVAPDGTVALSSVARLRKVQER